MSWLQLSLRVGRARLESVEKCMWDCGAISLTCVDASDHPILEPAPGETPLWEEVELRALFDKYVDTDTLRIRLASFVDTGRFSLEPIADRNWVRAWMDDFRPMKFGRRLWVCPQSMEPPEPSAVTLRLDPGLAFGTGQHPTTALCLEWLQGLQLAGLEVLDYGCGSGILAIAALLLGADQAWACDIDPQALEATRVNACTNGVAGKLWVGEPKRLPDNQGRGKVQLLMANILATPLTQLAPEFARLTQPGGKLAITGILGCQQEAVAQRYGRWFDLANPVCRDQWVLLWGQRRSND